MTLDSMIAELVRAEVARQLTLTLDDGTPVKPGDRAWRVHDGYVLP